MHANMVNATNSLKKFNYTICLIKVFVIFIYSDKLSDFML